MCNSGVVQNLNNSGAQCAGILNHTYDLQSSQALPMESFLPEQNNGPFTCTQEQFQAHDSGRRLNVPGAVNLCEINLIEQAEFDDATGVLKVNNQLDVTGLFEILIKDIAMNECRLMITIENSQCQTTYTFDTTTETKIEINIYQGN